MRASFCLAIKPMVRNLICQNMAAWLKLRLRPFRLEVVPEYKNPGACAPGFLQILMKGLESAVDTQTASPAAVVRVSCNQRVRSAGDNSLELQLVGDVVSFDANVEVLGR